MYAKLFAQVVNSSLTHTEPIEVRGVFFMMLAIADRAGNVPGIDPAIARIINVPMDTFQEAIGRLMSPDPYSQSQEEGGRRLVRLEGTPGYRIVNYEKYQSIVTDQHRREYMRVKKAESRERLEHGGPPTARSRRENRAKTLEEVMEWGVMTGVPAAVCRDFWEKMERFARKVEGEELPVWMSDDKNDENGESPVRNWKRLLQGFKTSGEAKQFRRQSKTDVKNAAADAVLRKHLANNAPKNGTDPTNPASSFGSG